MLRQHGFQLRFANQRAASQQSTRLADKADNRHPSGDNTIPIVGSAEQYSVRRIYCIGRNDAAELVASLGKGGRNIPLDRALQHVYGYTLELANISPFSRPIIFIMRYKQCSARFLRRE